MSFKDLFIKGSHEICQQVPEPTTLFSILAGVIVLLIFGFIFYLIPRNTGEYP